MAKARKSKIILQQTVLRIKLGTTKKVVEKTSVAPVQEKSITLQPATKVAKAAPTKKTTTAKKEVVKKTPAKKLATAKTKTPKEVKEKAPKKVITNMKPAKKRTSVEK